MYKNKDVDFVRKIMAIYDKKSIRVYQAYNNKIADEVLTLGEFGESFNLNRMTWIKTSFLWMMYRCGWGTKTNQERILAIDMTLDGFNTILENAVITKFTESNFTSYDEWKSKLNHSQARCQWDPDRDIYGNPLNKRAIQLGIKECMLNHYVNNWIINITDISDIVYRWRQEIAINSFNKNELPNEKEYNANQNIKAKLGIN